ncbi:type II toxin-antitoxin system PemK/MazF family toxin [Caballeronia sp. EK]|uniref:type II toxin-antitoxin system PemK/MazF family toxin n=1 Tax=Caballeronia sp. EK TaxID=2767469 RepID=UPI00165545F6|nr:type II toxin-antitoxin system PemK/MazF family toxin [Caballeronia sp. EK]MBC8638041.1 type II toxin-antitoxin system PemK/MazF family toxin [Caballeronia sp. EK]
MKDGIPDAGDVVRLHVGPARGHKQDGYRAVLVISDIVMNDITGRFTGLPITSTIRGWETEVPIASLKRPGVALVDQLRSWSHLHRELAFRGETVTEEEFDAAKYAIRAFLQL